MKKKGNERLIAKMISSLLIAAGISGIATGVALGHSAVKKNNDDYRSDIKYTAGIGALTIGSTSLSIGFATYPFGNEKEEQDEKQNNL